MSQYFNKFPTISYNGVDIKNITLRTKVLDSFKRDANNFYPYIIKDGETADALAFDYYDDPNYMWLIYLINDIIDPYHDWPLSSYMFDEYMKVKYGSVYEAQSTTLYYKKKPVKYYMNLDTNTYLAEADYDSSVSGYNWKLVTIDEEITLQSATTPNLTIWSAVTAYDNEFEENENKRHIRLLDKRLVSVVESQLKDLLNE